MVDSWGWRLAVILVRAIDEETEERRREKGSGRNREMEKGIQEMQKHKQAQADIRVMQ